MTFNVINAETGVPRLLHLEQGLAEIAADWLNARGRTRYVVQRCDCHDITPAQARRMRED